MVDGDGRGGSGRRSKMGDIQGDKAMTSKPPSLALPARQPRPQHSTRASTSIAEQHNPCCMSSSEASCGRLEQNGGSCDCCLLLLRAALPRTRAMPISHPRNLHHDLYSTMAFLLPLALPAIANVATNIGVGVSNALSADTASVTLQVGKYVWSNARPFRLSDLPYELREHVLLMALAESRSSVLFPSCFSGLLLTLP